MRKHRLVWNRSWTRAFYDTGHLASPRLRLHASRVGEAEQQMTNKDGHPITGQAITGQDLDPAMEQNLDYGAGSGGAPGPQTRLTAEAQGQIGRQLRRAYEELLAEPLPDRFSKLLEELAKREPSS